MKVYEEMLHHPRSSNKQGQETFLAPYADKKTHKYEKEFSNIY